jgi:hypothetical protein
MNAFTLPTATANFESYAYNAEKIWDKSKSLDILIDGKVIGLGLRYCRPSVTTHKGATHKEITHSELYALIEKAEKVIGWTELTSGEYQYVSYK